MCSSFHADSCLHHFNSGRRFLKNNTTPGFRYYQSSHNSQFFYIGMRILNTHGLVLLTTYFFMNLLVEQTM
ncbi:hypothetical protein Bca4012_037132 [Brassica carinata]